MEKGGERGKGRGEVMWRRGRGRGGGSVGDG